MQEIWWRGTESKLYIIMWLSKLCFWTTLVNINITSEMLILPLPMCWHPLTLTRNSQAVYFYSPSCPPSFLLTKQKPFFNFIRVLDTSSLPLPKEWLSNDQLPVVGQRMKREFLAFPNDYWENRVRSQGSLFEGNWCIIVLCTMFLVSCIFFNKCLYFSCYMVRYLLDRRCTYTHTHTYNL